MVQLTMKASLTPKERSVTGPLCCGGAHVSVWPSCYPCFFLMTTASWVSILLPLSGPCASSGTPMNPFSSSWHRPTSSVYSIPRASVIGSGRGARSKPGQQVSFQELLLELVGKMCIFNGIAELRRITSSSCWGLCYKECQLDTEAKIKGREKEREREADLLSSPDTVTLTCYKC